MSPGRQVPWASWQEWKQVGDALSSQNRSDQLRALSQVAPAAARVAPIHQSSKRPVGCVGLAPSRNPNVAMRLIGSPGHQSRLVRRTALAALKPGPRYLCTQVQLWRARGKIPLAVDITAVLVELRVRCALPKYVCFSP